MKRIVLDCEALDIKRKLILLPKYFWPATGGLQIASARIGTTLADMGWQVSIYYPAEPDLHPDSYLENSRIKKFAVQKSRQEFWDSIPTLLGQDMGHCSVLAVGLEHEESIDMQIRALQILRKAGALTFLRVTTTNDIASRVNTARALMLSQLDGLVVLNRAMEKEAKNLNFKSQFIHRFPVMVDTNRYRPNKDNLDMVRKNRGVEQNVPIVLYVGRLDPQKRIELLIKAMVGVDALLLIIGDPTLGPNIKETERYLRLAQKYGLRSIRIESQVPEAEVPDILQTADVFVTASHREGMSNAVLEASSVGLNIAGFSIPGIEEIAKTLNWDGFFLAHPDSGYAGLRKAIQNALNSLTSNWRSSRENGLMAFSSQKIGAFWSLLLSENKK